MIKKEYSQGVQPISEEDLLVDKEFFNERHSKKVKSKFTFKGRSKIEREFSMFKDFDLIDNDDTKRDESVSRR